MYAPSSDIPASLAMIQAAAGPDEAERIDRAFRFAEAAHAGQTRDEGTPFIEHPVRVAAILWNELGSRDVDLVIAALNHDTVEDSEHVGEELIESFFGSRIAGMVLDVTKKQVPEEEKAQRDRDYLNRLPDLSHDSRMLKLADRIDNVRSVVHSGEPDKARRYLEVSRAAFVPLALQTDQVAARLLGEALEEIERMLEAEKA